MFVFHLARYLSDLYTKFMLIDCRCMFYVQILNTCVYMQTILDVYYCVYFITFLMRFQHAPLKVINITVVNTYPYILHLPF